MSFEVWYNPSDSLLLRVNVYDTDGPAGKPGTNLNKSGHNMLCTVRKDDRFVSLDLKPFDIYVKDDFIVSLELLKIYGESELGLALAGAGQEHYGSFRKYVSQDKWEKLDDRNMAYKLETSLLVSEKVAQRFEKRKSKKERKQQTVSGFVIFRGKMISEVQVVNNRTKELVLTDEKGRYRIPIRNNDILTFSKDGLKTKHLQIKDKFTVNVIMEPNE
ncbi:hypothetical protein VC82_2630 [Flagellimonas lutaonensis]|uniref:Uncharacterized protein n=1 Tax=Flagellimonas lutaonensis TaxID=516051 RepID=A0A0D5YV46_9FLAO|nr:hypothetical protein VC82_2630 [Allomuricauda lutaonensis]